MNILENTFKASLDPVKSYFLEIETASAFAETGGNDFLPSKLAYVPCAVESNGALNVPQINNIPATNNLDSQGIFYKVQLIEVKGRTVTRIPFFFDDEGAEISEIRIPQSVSGEITWREIRTAANTCYPVSLFQPGFLNVEQQFGTFVRQSQIDSILSTLGAALPFQNAVGAVINVPLNANRKFRFQNANAQNFEIALV